MAQRDGAKARLRKFLREHIGEVLDSGALRRVGGSSEWARRLRELRDEEGMQILSHRDRSDLKPGQYVLVSSEPRPAAARGISKEVRALVLNRDGFTCQVCGAAAGDVHPYDGRRVRLTIGHIVEKQQGGTDDPSNLRAECTVCNEGAANIALQSPTARKLLAQIRRAPRDDELEVLEWLVRKFPTEAREKVGRASQ